MNGKKAITTKKAVICLSAAVVSGYFHFPYAYSVLKALNLISYEHHGASNLDIVVTLASLFSVGLSWVFLEEWLKKYRPLNRLCILFIFLCFYLGFPVVMTLLGKVPI